MKIIKVLLLLLILCVSTSELLQGTEITGKVIYIIDGDTISILDKKNTSHIVRLFGIDCPEKKQPYNQEAKQFLSNKILGKSVQVKTIKNDEITSIIGKVYLGNGYINLQMVQEGWAWHYKQYSKDEDLAEAEIQARKKKLGLWQDSNPTPPWEWRKTTETNASLISNKKNQNIKNLFWVTDSTHSIHNSKCRFFKKSAGKLYKLNELTFGMKNCKVCGGASAFTKKQNNPELFKQKQNIPNPYNAIKIGLALPEYLAMTLQNNINKALIKHNISKTVILKPMFGYDQKIVALKNNNIDIMEGGFLTFVEFCKRRKKGKVILHACYFKNTDEKMFTISGLIIAKKGNNIDLKDIPNKTIFAVSESSSSGFRLQKIYLQNLGIELNKPIKFLTHHDAIEEAVLNTPDSVGFVGSFQPLGMQTTQILAHTHKTPGGVIFADKNVVNGEALVVIKENIYKFYIELFKKGKINHFFVLPIHKDYRKFFPDYKPKKSNNNIYFIISIIVLIITVGIILIHDKIAEKKRDKELISKLGLNNSIKKIESLINENNKIWLDELNKSINHINKNEFLPAISEITKRTESILKETIKQFNSFISIEKQKLKFAQNTFKGHLERYHKFANDIDTNKDEYISKCQISADDLIKIKKVIYLSAPFSLLYNYRNLTHHIKDGWTADATIAQEVIICHTQIILTLLEAGFFEEKRDK